MPHSTTRWYTTTLSTTQERNLVSSSSAAAVPTGQAVNRQDSPILESSRTTHTLTRQCTKTTHHRKHHSQSHRDRDRAHHTHRRDIPRQFPSSNHQSVNSATPVNRGGEIMSSTHNHQAIPPTQVRGGSTEVTDRRLAQDTLMQESANWTVEEVQNYIDRMAIDEDQAVRRACTSPIPDQSSLLSNSSSSATLVEDTQRKVRFDPLPESINPLRLFQPHFKDHLTDPVNKVTIFGHVAVHPEPSEMVRQQQPTASSGGLILRERGKTFFPKLNGIKPLTKIFDGPSPQAPGTRVRDEVENLNTLSNKEEQKKYILDIIENRLSEIDHRLETERDEDKRRRYRELKWDVTRLYMEVRVSN
ncbi:hypothetical protein I302_108797 [Kwoniella bestiolae CBS 10118]|uniref:Uncharacterized protein n=1 Tax=Kwoniella bestiolae CBS 10118 TaxID=1296100 RepID=A0A1B9FU46_9TREE|nr:hypothetical protein I302_07934 [Kwoniella bestiolae CBS 10118]OCF22289.1 hypothetical protein I302_07934 [Kwoniella bestiolae CBS 10118]